MRFYILAFVLLAFTESADAADSRVDYNPQARKLIGYMVHNEPMTLSDVQLLDPVCVLILNHFGKGESWPNILKNTGLLDQPMYRMAKGAGSLHHWCYGKIAYYRSTRATTSRMRQHYLDRSASEYKFMIDMAEFRDPNWPYIADMYAYYGESLFRLNKNSDAVSALLTAISLNPKLPQPYIALIDHLKRSGSKSKALDFSIEGLRHIPTSKPLQKRYLALGGKQPFPTPHDDSSTAPGAPSTSPTHTDHGTPTLDSITPPSASSASPPINPYCKFCP